MNLFRKPKLVVLFLEYDVGKYLDSFEVLNSYIEDLNLQKTYFIIDNLHIGDYIFQTSENIYRLGGDNSSWEFSGWSKAVNFLKKNKMDFDVALFVNDSFRAYGWTLLNQGANLDIITRAYHNNTLIGQMDTKNIQLDAYGYDVSRWICTNCFFISSTILHSLDDIVSVNQDGMSEVIDENYWQELLFSKLITTRDLAEGSFSIEVELPKQAETDLLIELDRSFVPAQCGVGPDTRELGIFILDFKIGETCVDSIPVRNGFFSHETGGRWMSKTARLNALRGGERLFIKGLFPEDLLETRYGGEMRIDIYQTSPIFSKTAPLGLSYKQMVVKWLTEEWHSKFQINRESWVKYRAKVQAMLNESLFTAKVKEKGFMAESYLQLMKKGKPLFLHKMEHIFSHLRQRTF